MSRKYIVAGGFGVLGRAVVTELERQGHKVAAVDMAPVPDGYAGIGIGGVDLADEAAVAKGYDEAVKALGGLDGVANIAGGFVWEMQADGSLDSWDRMYRMNLRTATVSSRTAMGLLGSGGAIVNVGAAAAGNADTGMAPYAASKAGVMALTQSLANELRGKNVRVNAVLPTILDTPTNRADMPDADTSAWVQPAAAAKIVAFLLSPDSGCVTGAGIPLSLGS